MAFFDKLKEVGTGLYENFKGLKPIELIGTALEAPFKLTRAAISDVLHLTSETDKARTEKAGKDAEELKNKADRPGEKLTTPSHLDWAARAFKGKSSEIRERIKVKDGVLLTSYSMDGEFHEAGEPVPDEEKMYRNLELRITGREPQTLDPEKKEFWNVFKHIPKVFSRVTIPNLGAIATGSAVGLALYNGLAAVAPTLLSAVTMKIASLGLPLGLGSLSLPYPIISTLGGLAGLSSFALLTGGAVAASIGLGYLTKNIILKSFFPRNKVGELYIYEATSGDLSASTLKTNINKENKKLLAQHSINGETALEGDIVLSRDMKFDQLKAYNEEVSSGSSAATKYFYDTEGNQYKGSELIKAGTTIPHGTKFDGGRIPEGSAYQEIKPFDGNESIFDAASAGTIKLSRNYKLTEPLQLSVPVSLPFDYTDVSGVASQKRIAGALSPRGAVIPAGTEMIRGTIIPRGSKRVALTQDISELNEVTELHVRPQMHIGGKVIRRDLYLDEDNKSQFGGITIPTKTRFSIGNKTYDTTIEGIKEAFKLKLHEPIRQRENSIQVFIDRIPAGAKFPIATIAYVKGGAKHEEGATPRIGEQESDYKLTKNLNLVAFAGTFNCDPANFRLRLSDDIPAGHAIPEFRDESGTTRETGKRIPAGVEIPAVVIAGGALVLPADTVLPGGSEVYDVSKTEKVVQEKFERAVREIAAKDLSVTPAGVVWSAFDVRSYLEQIPSVAEAMKLVKGNSDLKIKLNTAVENKLLNFIRMQIAKIPAPSAAATTPAAKSVEIEGTNEVKNVRIIEDQLVNSEFQKSAEQELARKIEKLAA